MFIEYQEIIISTEDNIQKLAVVLGKLETKAISKLVDVTELANILRRFLTVKEQDIYYKSKYRLKQLLNSMR